ncbi:MAG TPA: hypothetical protein VFC30_09675 [Solirubrobacteraceae bacterium]|nr:hypothetical protein [Solirubrobacteraceae bacterium]
MPAGKAHATKPLLVATGRYTFAAASAAKVRIKLTSSGKLLLRRSSQLKLTAEGAFTSIGKPTISASRTFFLNLPTGHARPGADTTRLLASAGHLARAYQQ